MWAAYEAKDITYLGGIHSGPLKAKEEGEKLMGLIHGENPNDAPDYSFEMTFGCQNKITGLFKTQLVRIYICSNRNLQADIYVCVC